MTGAQWLVVAVGIAAIGWVNWYFFFAERRATRVSERQGKDEEGR